MTPLEELQAAHKRLASLRDADSAEYWCIGYAERDDPEEPWDRAVLEDSHGYSIGEYMPYARADLIVTLHSTIDAQLAVLSAGIEDETGRVELYTRIGATELLSEHTPWLLRTLLPLARAINGTP